MLTLTHYVANVVGHFNVHTHFFNALMLNKQSNYINKPFTFDWNKEINLIEFL